MAPPSAERPPYLAATAVALAVLGGYLFTLAPSVTFWDAGELIAASRILGIPHPPGTPLFVLMAHVWGLLLPVGEFAWRTNLMSAVFSAAGAGCWFLVAQEVLDTASGPFGEGDRRLVSTLAGVSAALVSGFGFTMWQNSNETEVYAVATFTIAAVSWLGFRWRAHRGTPAASRWLLLAVYLGGLSMGNHLLALLVGPALVGFLVAELRLRPAREVEERRREWGEAAVVAGAWAFLVGTGLGNAGLILFGALCFAGTAVLAVRWGAGRFALFTLGLALVGTSTYLFLLLRAGQSPMLNEADPSTWEALLAVIRREQYGIRTPLDDPTQFHGPDNPGRTLTLIGLQLLNYVQYFDWQWAKTVGGAVGGFPLRAAFTLLFLTLGLQGSAAQRRADRAGWWLVFLLFLTTGLGLVGYMNFEAGYSIGFEQYPDSSDHEVRERDYFFIASFAAWGVWVGIGLGAVIRRLAARFTIPVRRMTPVFALAMLPALLNFGEASRRHVPGALLARDFAWSLLNSVPPYGVLFTFGDNDTFPLWWAQEVEGVRPDVTVVCLALAQTDWYMRQLRDHPTRPFRVKGAAEFWQGDVPPRPDWPLHTMTDAEIGAAVPQLLPQDVTIRLGDRPLTLPGNTVLDGKDFVTLRILQQNHGRRPLAWALSAAGTFFGLEPLLVQQGLAIRLMPSPPDSTSPRYDFQRMVAAPLDLVISDSLLFQVYRYAGLLESGVDQMESTALGMAATMAVPFTQMAYAMEARGDVAGVVRYLESAARLSTNPAIRAALAEARLQLEAKPK
jgi:hypothetical protein